jgi:hypothetical protein
MDNDLSRGFVTRRLNDSIDAHLDVAAVEDNLLLQYFWIRHVRASPESP